MSHEESGPAELYGSGVARRRKLFQFDPTISSGMLTLIFAVVTGFVGTYVTITNQQARMDERLTGEKANATAEMGRVKESISDLKSDVKDLSGSMTNVKESLAEIKAQLREKGKP